MDDLSYLLALHSAPRIGSTTLNQLCALPCSLSSLFDTPEILTTFELKKSQLETIREALRTPDWKSVEQTLKWAEAEENHILLLSHKDYPELLKQIHSPPPLLFVKGHLAVLSDIQLAMVGSRNPSVDGSETAWQFAHHLAQHGMVITSGMALGIDTQSHKGALAAGGRSIAVAGTGLNRIYPARNKELAWQLIEQGAIISEYPLETGPLKANFPQRNRIISGLSVGTLVVEAALKSGSLITAREALEQGREVFAIPGSIHNPLSRGCHQLIKTGAKLVETADDILEELDSLMLASHLPDQPELFNTTKEAPIPEPDPLLPKVQQQILKNIGYSPVAVDLVIERSGLNAADVSANLVLLEINDYIQSHPGNMVSLKPK